MNKVIHRAVRRDLRRFLDATARFPAGNQARADELARAWDNFHAELTHHHEGEHETAWPALFAVGVDPELLATLDTEHDAMAAALSETAAAMGGLRVSASAEDAAAVHASFEHLQQVTVTHLDHEEAEIEPVLLAKKDTPELKAMSRTFRKAPPTRGGRMLAWLVDGTDAETRDALGAEIPTPVLLVMTRVFGRGYRREIAPVWRA